MLYEVLEEIKPDKGIRRGGGYFIEERLFFGVRIADNTYVNVWVFCFGW